MKSSNGSSDQLQQPRPLCRLSKSCTQDATCQHKVQAPEQGASHQNDTTTCFEVFSLHNITKLMMSSSSGDQKGIRRLRNIRKAKSSVLFSLRAMTNRYTPMILVKLPNNMIPAQQLQTGLCSAVSIDITFKTDMTAEHTSTAISLSLTLCLYLY